MIAFQECSRKFAKDKKDYSFRIMKILPKIKTITRFVRYYSPLGYYYRRHSLYTGTGKIALCCIAKLENRYIRDFVEYYKDLHFDKIFLYDNNDVDGERFEEVIEDFIASGFVEVVDFRGRKVAQLEAYEDCSARHSREFDWIAFFDCDEYLTFTDNSTDIHAFLSQEKFLPYQAIHVNWMVFGDNELLDYDGRSVTERFINPVLPLNFVTHNRPVNNHIKTIIRGGKGMSSLKWHSPHTPHSDYLRCCSPEAVETDIRSPFQDFVFETVYLRHFSTKTIGEWITNKMKRGLPDRTEAEWEKMMTLDLFFECNKRTPEKLAYAEQIKGKLK